MKLGIYINAQHPDSDDPVRKFAEMVEQVRLMRQHGFDSLWGGEHHATPGYHYLPLLGMLQRLSAETEGMELGTNIVLLPLHNPIEIAELGAFLDVLTEGRFLLGVGLGYRQAEFDMFKVPIKQRVNRTVEGVDIIRRLWSEDNVSYRGRHWQLDDVTIRPQPVQKPGPPILVGAQVEASIRRAADIGDGWCMVPSTSSERMAAEIVSFKQARADAGLPESPHLARLVRSGVCPGAKRQALKRAAPFLLAKYESYAQWGLPGVNFDPNDSAGDTTPEARGQSLCRRLTGRRHRGVDDTASDRRDPPDDADQLARHEAGPHPGIDRPYGPRSAARGAPAHRSRRLTALGALFSAVLSTPIQSSRPLNSDDLELNRKTTRMSYQCLSLVSI